MKLWDTLKRKRAFHIILLTGIAVLVIHVLLNNRYGTTAVLYVAVPFCIALWLAWQRERWSREKPQHFEGQVLRLNMLIRRSEATALCR